MSQVVGILLAAGASQRFGADKLNHRLADGVSVAVHACRNLFSATDRVFAVVRPGNQELYASLQAEGAQVQFCPDADQGMGNSLAFAVRQCPAATGWVIALADMPWIASSTLHTISTAIRNGAHIAAPTWEGQRGHPVGFAHALGAELMALSGDAGAKTLIQNHRALLQVFECNDPAILQDIDTPDDLRAHSNLSPQQ